MKTILVCWLGETDVQVLQGSDDIGPIAKAVKALPYEEVHIISDLEPDNNSCYENWLRDQTSGKVEIHSANYSGPAKVENVTAATVAVVDKIKESCREEALLTFHLSSGEPIMRKVLSDLAETRYFPTASIELSEGKEVEGIIYNLKWSDSKLLSSITRQRDKALERWISALALDAPKLSQITYQSPAMEKTVTMAWKVAQHSTVPVLIEGESGSGKEGLAKLVHEASPRKGKPFIPVNCGAISSKLIESALFGYKKGSYSGSRTDKDQIGYFEEADSGTLFLDEVGELSAAAQVKLLRVLQEGEIMPVGASKAKKIDVRIIAATNKDLVEGVKSGKFRSDLFYRLAVGVIKVPSLRERKDDVDPIVDEILKDINGKSATVQGFKSKKLSLNVRNIIKDYSWPGNVRELQNTLWRAAIWSLGETIEEQDIQDAIISIAAPDPDTSHSGDGILGRPLGKGFSLRKLQAEVMRHYLRRALDETNGKKSVAAHLIDLPSHQTFSSWMRKYDV